MTYTPQPGTVPARAIDHLASLGEGAEISTSDLAAALGLEPDTIHSYLVNPRKHGMLKSRKRADVLGNHVFWSVGSGEAAGAQAEPAAPAPATEFNFRVGSAGDKAVRALKLHGQRMSDMALAIAIEVELDELVQFLAYPVKLGALKREIDQSKDDIYWWSLGDWKPVAVPPSAPAPVVAPLDGVDIDRVHRQELPAPAVAAKFDEPKGIAGAARRPETVKETTQRGAVAGAGEDAKRDGQPAIPGGLRIALWSDGELHIQRPGSSDIVLSKVEMRQVVKYLDAISLDIVREAA